MGLLTAYLGFQIVRVEKKWGKPEESAVTRMGGYAVLVIGVILVIGALIG